MRSVRISWKTAQVASAAIGAMQPTRSLSDAYRELQAAMKLRPAVKAARKAKTAKRVLHNQDTSDVHRLVIQRSRGLCELHPFTEDAHIEADGEEMHHALGRKVPQSDANCVWVCRDCHDAITLNRAPVKWHETQAAFFADWGHTETARELRKKVAKAKYRAKTKAALSRGREVSP